MRALLFVRPMFATLALASLHCSSTSSGGADAGGGDSGGGDSSIADSASDSATDARSTVNGCGTADFADHTAANDARAITFPGDTAFPAQFAPPCMKIRVGQSVTWNGGFTGHPLEPMNGDMSSPIVATTGVTTKTFAFPTAGTFGYDCANHPATMLGAILVVP